MPILTRGRYTARYAETQADLDAAQSLRSLAFFGDAEREDGDVFDDKCRHVLVENSSIDALVCAFRLLPLQSGREINGSYSAQYYELSSLSDFEGPMVEMGRFCVHPDHLDPDIVRVAWGAMAQIVDAEGIEMLFGCSSFHGTEAAAYTDAFSLLKERHLAPKRWLPRVKAPRVFPFGRRRLRKPNVKAAAQVMPPLLKTYLMMGGWVSDHAVVDGDMNTLHVFTGVEINAIPPARKRLLRAVAG